MARYTGPVCRYCRREAQKLFLKGERCFGGKCSMEEGRHPVPPGGQHFGRRRTTSDYNTQLREKQKAKRIYGLSERQFKNYYRKAAQKKGVTGDTLVEQLERRLDNAVYRMGFAVSRAQARQLVSHGHFFVNDRPTNIPSWLQSCSIHSSIPLIRISSSRMKMVEPKRRWSWPGAMDWLTRIMIYA